MRTWVCRDSLTLMWHIYSWLLLELLSFPGVSLEKRLPRSARCHMCTSLKAASAPTFTAPKKEGRRTDGRTPVSDLERATEDTKRVTSVGGDVDGGGRPDVCRQPGRSESTTGRWLSCRRWRLCGDDVSQAMLKNENAGPRRHQSKKNYIEGTFNTFEHDAHFGCISLRQLWV